MTAPETLESLALRLKAVEAGHFVIVEQIRKVADASDRNANLLDDFEEVLTDVSVTSAEHAEVMAMAMAQRQTQLDLDNTAAPVPGPSDPPVAPMQPATPEHGESPDMPSVATLHSWVEDHIAPMVRKVTTTGEGGGIRWCRQWWEHVDAVERFIALYLAWEELSHEDSATWLSVYLRDHLDPHLSTLTSPYGPFYACIPAKHSDTAQAVAQAELPESLRSTSRQP